MNCKFCGTQLSTGDIACPACGAKVSAGNLAEQILTGSKSEYSTSYVGGVPMAKLSVYCWVLMFILSIVHFQFMGGVRFYMDIGQIAIWGSLALLAGTFVTARNGRKELMLFPIGFYLIASLAELFLFGRIYYFDWLYLLYLALVAVVAFVFFHTAKNRLPMRRVAVVSIMCFVVWCGTALIGYSIFYWSVYGISMGVINGFGIPFRSGTIKDLTFFAGTALFCWQD